MVKLPMASPLKKKSFPTHSAILFDGFLSRLLLFRAIGEGRVATEVFHVHVCSHPDQKKLPYPLQAAGPWTLTWFL